jgi:hypothetical protein
VNTCTAKDEEFPVRDLGRVVYSDANIDGGDVELLIEVTYEYEKNDEGVIYMQTLDKNSADFYTNLDAQLQSILNPFVEPVLLKTKIDGAMGVFGSAVLSEAIPFVYPQDHP